LGNDYLILDPAHLPPPLHHGLTPAWVQRICDRHRGVGGDGIVLGPLAAKGVTGDRSFACQIWNPDGSQAEVSGNGLRIFARYLLDVGYVREPASGPVFLHSGGRVSTITYPSEPDGFIHVSLGRARLLPMPDLPADALAVLGPGVVVDVGNPHCVFFPAEAGTALVDAALARRWGPTIESHPGFPQRTNVQFAHITGPNVLALEIWERGAGYTLASGSSSCAAAVAAVATGRCPDSTPLHVDMPGGRLHVTVTSAADAWTVQLAGPVTPVAHGRFADEWLRQFVLRTDVRFPS
ncbi:MAG: diaminopimelate epimerase, partial [Caldilineae bacterium]